MARPNRLGLWKLDVEDQRLGALANELDQAIADGLDAEEIQKLMSQLLREALSHFEHEEQMLSQGVYPLPKGHAALNLQIRTELEHAMEALRDIEAHAMWTDYGLLVKQLFLEHILHESMQFRTILRSDSQFDSKGT